MENTKVVDPNLPQVEIPSDEYWKPVLKAFEKIDEPEEFNELLQHFQYTVSESSYAELHSLLSLKGWFASVAEEFVSDFNCPGDDEDLRMRIRACAGAALYFYHDGSVLLETKDELSVWRGSPDEIKTAAEAGAKKAA